MVEELQVEELQSVGQLERTIQIVYHETTFQLFKSTI